MAIERRRHPRETFMTTIEYALLTYEDFRSTKCVSANITQAGMGFCMYSREALSAGQTIVIKKSDLPFKCRRAEVLWSKKLNEKTYSAGLRCFA